MSSNLSIKNLLKRIAAVGIAAAIVFTGTAGVNAGGFTPKTKEASENPEAYNVMPIYKWHRVRKQSDLPRTGLTVPVMFCWKEDGNMYYSTGSYTGQYYAYGIPDYGKWDGITGKKFSADSAVFPNPFSSTEKADTFFTTTPVTDWTMMMTGSVDKSNENAKKMRFWIKGSLISGYDDWDWEGNRDSASHDQWSVYTAELDGDYGDDLDDGYVRVYHEVSGDDVGFMYYKDHMFGYESDTYYYSTFVMYWAEVIYVSAITEDYEIRDGMVMNVDDGVILNEGVTLTVMPGGVLSIEGQFYNNGTILNQGTVIVQPNSCINSFDPTSATAGAIKNTGAEVDTKANAQKSKSDKEAKIKSLKESNEKLNEELGSAISSYKEADAARLKLLNEAGKGKEALSVTLNRKAAEIEVEELNIKTLEKNGTAAEKIAEYKANKLAPLVTQYEELYKPVAELDEIIKTGHETETRIKAQIETNNTTVDKLNTQIAELNVLINSNTNVKRRGEGNLIIMENARIGLEDKAQLIITDGGSCICNGLILSPQPVLINNSKFEIRQKGALICEYHLTKNKLNLMELPIYNAGTRDVTLDGLEPVPSPTNMSVGVSGDYFFIIDGAFRYYRSPVTNVETNKMLALTDGQGSWSYINSPVTRISDDGTIYEEDDYGNIKGTNKDGATSYYEAKTGVLTELFPDGRKTVTQKDGSKRTDYPNYDYQVWFPSGELKESFMQYDGYYETYYWHSDRGSYYTRHFDNPQEDGAYTLYIYSDGSYERGFDTVNGVYRKTGFDKDGNWLYDYRYWTVSEWNSEYFRDVDHPIEEYTYSDRVELYRDHRLQSTTPRN